MAINIALAGNPNCGKTTMFNDLTGANQYVGNWPGVTVEKKEGRYRADKEVVVTDLPGVYSLSPYTPEEIVTRDYLMSGKPDAVINLVDATNLERNLYLTTQIIDLGIPPVVALTIGWISWRTTAIRSTSMPLPSAWAARWCRPRRSRAAAWRRS